VQDESDIMVNQTRQTLPPPMQPVDYYGNPTRSRMTGLYANSMLMTSEESGKSPKIEQYN